jgi:UDP-2,3-diacylglucosamine pyrophosphatase LpxH
VLRAVLADLHVGQVPGDLDRFLATIAALERRGVGEVVFLGDLFRALVGFSRFWDATTRRGLDELAALRRTGVRVVMVEGNRDFFLDVPELDAFRDASGNVHSFVAGGRRFLLEHGDLINRRDRSYLFWRTVSKSAAARVWAHLVPRRLAQRIVFGAESRLKETNFTYRAQLPIADLTAAAERHFAAGVDVVLWGHFHRAWKLERGRRAAYVVPGWLETGAVVWVGGDGSLAIETERSEQIVDSAPGSWYQEKVSMGKAR